jgi:oligoribonuclease NrnB/cAMP/cGMP phosphodiesterase (DHH superfamily)
MGICCDPYAIGFVLPDSEYNDYLFKLVNGNYYDDDGDYPKDISEELPEVCEDRPNINDSDFETILITEDMYERITDLFGDIDIWRDSLLSLINKTFNINARSLLYIYE